MGTIVYMFITLNNTTAFIHWEKTYLSLIMVSPKTRFQKLSISKTATAGRTNTKL